MGIFGAFMSRTVALQLQGMTNKDTEDYGVFASAKPVAEIEYRYYCTSFSCGGNKAKKTLKLVSKKKMDGCPDCGHALFLGRN